MPKRKNAARAPRPSASAVKAQAYTTGFNDGVLAAAEQAKALRDDEKAAAPRRSFWISQTANGFEMNESTVGSVRGPSWTGASAACLGDVIDSLTG